MFFHVLTFAGFRGSCLNTRPLVLARCYYCCLFESILDRFDNHFYQSLLILTALFQHDLINVSYLTACYLYQVMMTLHFLNDVANDAESTQK